MNATGLSLPPPYFCTNTAPTTVLLASQWIANGFAKSGLHNIIATGVKLNMRLVVIRSVSGADSEAKFGTNFLYQPQRPMKLFKPRRVLGIGKSAIDFPFSGSIRIPPSPMMCPK